VRLASEEWRDDAAQGRDRKHGQYDNLEDHDQKIILFPLAATGSFIIQQSVR
jgi:hypothetical protein